MADEATTNDSNAVVTDDLDAFSQQLFGGKTPTTETETKDEETSEIETPSATEGNESEEAPENEESDDGNDAPANEVNEDEPNKEEDNEDDEIPLAKPIKGRKSAKERINELTADKRAAEREVAELRRLLEERDAKPEIKTTKTETLPLEEEAPNPDAMSEDGTPLYPLGEFDPLFIRDLTRFTIKVETEAAKREAEEEKQRKEVEASERELLDSWGEKLATAAEKLPDLPKKSVVLEETFADLDPNYGKFLAATIMSLEYGPEVLDYLADNLSEAQKIVASGPTKAIVALGRIEARFANEEIGNKVEKGKIVKPSSAPTPPPRNKGSAVSQSVSGDTDDLDAFEKQFFTKKK